MNMQCRNNDEKSVDQQGIDFVQRDPEHRT